MAKVAWANVGSKIITRLNKLAFLDENTYTPSTNDTIIWDGSEWVPDSDTYAPSLRQPTGRAIVPIGGARGTYQPAEAVANYVPIEITDGTLDRVGCEVTSAGTSGAVCRLGLYEDDGGEPGALIFDAGTVDATTTGVKAVTISQAVTGPIVWVSAVTQGSASTRPTYRSMDGAVRHVTGQWSGSNITETACLTEAAVSGALPDPAASGGSDAQAILAFVRKSA